MTFQWYYVLSRCVDGVVIVGCRFTLFRCVIVTSIVTIVHPDSNTCVAEETPHAVTKIAFRTASVACRPFAIIAYVISRKSTDPAFQWYNVLSYCVGDVVVIWSLVGLHVIVRISIVVVTLTSVAYKHS